MHAMTEVIAEIREKHRLSQHHVGSCAHHHCGIVGAYPVRACRERGEGPYAVPVHCEARRVASDEPGASDDGIGKRWRVRLGKGRAGGVVEERGHARVGARHALESVGEPSDVGALGGCPLHHSGRRVPERRLHLVRHEGSDEGAAVGAQRRHLGQVLLRPREGAMVADEEYP